MVGTGAVDNPYIVTTAQELYDIRGGGATPGTTSTYYRQGNNIVIPPELSDIWCLGTNAEKTYNFKEYAGNGYKVSGLNFQQPSVDDVGLFPRLSSKSIIRDLGVDCNLIGGDKVGGICGSGSGTNISNCYSTGSVSGSSNVGGICGSGSVNISNCYSTGSVSGSSNVGGICGSSITGSVNIKISNCYSTGSVSGSSNVGGICGSSITGSGNNNISNCYSTGSVSGSSNVGGICGISSVTGSGTNNISSCYATGAVSGSSNVGGICGSSGGSINYLNRAHIRDCFALNQKIIRTDYSSLETFGRVVGILVNTNSLTNNYALETMLFYPDGEL